MERRKHVRYPLMGTLPEMNSARGTFRPLSVDVSRDGLGFTCSEPLHGGEQIVACFSDKNLFLTVMWTAAMPGGFSGQTVYRCGLSCQNIIEAIEKNPQLMVCKDA